MDGQKAPETREGREDAWRSWGHRRVEGPGADAQEGLGSYR